MPLEDNDLAVTYSLICSFLTERSHFKAAEAVKKAAKRVIVIESGGQDGPSLPIIVKQWKKFTADQEKKTTSLTGLTRSESSSSDTDTDSSEDSGSTSEETGSESGSPSNPESEANSRPLESNKRTKAIPFEPPSPARPKVGAKSKVKPRASESSPSSSGLDGELDSSSESESDDNDTKRIVSGSKVKVTKAGDTTIAVSPKSKPRDSSNSGSDCSSDEDSDSESEEDAPTPKAVILEVDGTNAPSVPGSRSPTGSSQTLPSIKSSVESGDGSESSDDSTSSSDSDSDSDDTGKKSLQENAKTQRVKVVNAPNTPKLDGHTAITKKRRTDESGGSVPTSVLKQPKAPNHHYKGKGSGQPRNSNTPFSRIKVDEIKFADERLKDNTFESRKAAVNDYGAKASADLIVTKGASFRKEKNKKKRGSYRGGDITMESHSIKFAD